MGALVPLAAVAWSMAWFSGLDLLRVIRRALVFSCLCWCQVIRVYKIPVHLKANACETIFPW